MVANARDFILAVKETTHTTFDEDASAFLEELLSGMSGDLDKRPGLTARERDSIVFFEGMLRGVQLQLTKNKQHALGKLGAMGLLGADGKPKLPEA